LHEAWSALSELYLDQQHEEADFKIIGKRLQGTGYSSEELAQILFSQVHPACCWNMKVPAGEWVEFDKEWLVARIESELNRPKPKGWVAKLRERQRIKEMEEMKSWVLPSWARTQKYLAGDAR
jgi:hypothetical protein